MTNSITDRAQSVSEDFEFLDSWEERFEHIIALGRALPPFPEALMTDVTKVRGCASQVWMYGKIEGDIFSLQAVSDAAIVSGLIAILIQIYDGSDVGQARSFDISNFFESLGLKSSLSAQRANGLAAMIKRIESILVL